MENIPDNEKYQNALNYAKTLSTDELFELFNQLVYPSHGYGAVMVWRTVDNYLIESIWTASLRNEAGANIVGNGSFYGNTANEAMTLLYAYSVSQGYLNQNNLPNQDAQLHPPCGNEFDVCSDNSDANCFKNAPSESLFLFQSSPNVCEGCIYNPTI
jgi:hypothetical protein